MYCSTLGVLDGCVFQGILVRTLEGHGHWVTTLSLNTDYVLRTGAFDRHGLVGEVPAGQEADEKAGWELMKGLTFSG